tara:strand:+ start:15004 stop:18582 length:3579 start_codon:yes stop_codon:yes gene_type:complete
MADIADLGFRVDSSGILKGEKALNKLDASGNRVVDTSKLMGVAFKASAAAIAAVSAAVVTGVARYKTYGTALAEVNTLLDSSWDKGSLDNLSDGVRDLTRQMGGDVVQNTKALYQVISAGADNSTDAIETLTQANKLAIAGVTDLETAVTSLAGPLNVYADSNLTAKEASDALLTAVKEGITTIPELSAAIGRVSPIAKTAGLTFDELTASVSTITAAGISTNEAVTGLKAAISAMVAPTKEAQTAIEEMGIKMSQADITGGNWAQVLRDIGEATGGDVEKLKGLLGSMEAVNAVIALTDNSGTKLNSVLEEMAVKTGATNVGFEKMTTGTARLGFEWNKLKAAADAALITLGERAAPVLIGIIDNFDKIIAGLVLATKAVASFAAGALGMRIIPAIFTAIAAQAAFASNTIALVGVRGAASVGAMNLLALATTGLGRAMALAGGPIGLVVIAVTSLALRTGETEKQANRLSTALSTLGVSGLDPSTAKTKKLADEMRNLNLLTAENNLISLKTSLIENGKEFDLAAASLSRLNSDLKKLEDGGYDAAAKAVSDEISVLRDNIDKTQQVQRLLNIQIGQGKGEVQEMKLAVAGLSKVTVTAKTTAEHFGEASSDAAQAVSEMAVSIDDASDKSKAGTKILDSYVGSIQDLIKKGKEAANIYGQYSSAAETVDAAILENIKSSERYSKVLEELNKRYPEGVRGSKEYKEALKTLGLETEKTTTVMADYWERFADGAFDSLKTFTKSAFTDFKSFGSDLKDLAKNLVTDLIATFASNKLKSVLKNLFSESTPSGGIFDTLKGLFGGGNTSDVGPVQPTTGMLGTVGTSIAKGASAAWGGVTKAASFLKTGAMKLIGSIPVWGQALLGAAAVYALLGSGARSPQQLGEDQLAAVDQATKEGRNTQVGLGQAGSTAVSFLGGFDENSIFFGVDLAKEQLQKVGDVFKQMTGANQALALKDGVIRIEDFNRKFSENNDTIVAQLKASIIQVELGITNSEKSIISSIDGNLVELDRLFDASAGNGETAAERLAAAYSQATDSNIQAGQDWVNSSGIDADRIAQIFGDSSAEVTAALFGVSMAGQDAFEQLANGANNQIDSIASSIGNLGADADRTLRLIQGGIAGVEGSTEAAARRFIETRNNLAVVQPDNQNQRSQNNGNQSTSQNEKDISSLTNEVSRLVDSQTSTNIKQQPMYGT